MTEKCPSCGEKKERLGTHWNMSPECEYPDLTRDQRHMLVGLLMGDASLARHGSDNPYLRVTNINTRFLKYIDSMLGVMSTGVNLSKTATESAQNAKDRGFSSTVNEENYHDVYKLRTRRHPWFRRHATWYETGQKRYPRDLTLRPFSAAYWYASDGTMNWVNAGPRMVFCCSNEGDRPEVVKSMFSKIGFSVKHNEQNDHFYLPASGTEEFTKWMSGSVPGYSYKWSTTSKKRYKSLKNIAERTYTTQT